MSYALQIMVAITVTILLLLAFSPISKEAMRLSDAEPDTEGVNVEVNTFEQGESGDREPIKITDDYTRHELEENAGENHLNQNEIKQSVVVVPADSPEVQQVSGVNTIIPEELADKSVDAVVKEPAKAPKDLADILRLNQENTAIFSRIDRMLGAQ